MIFKFNLKLFFLAIIFLFFAFSVFFMSHKKIPSLKFMIEIGFSSDISLRFLGFNGCGFISDLYYWSGPRLPVQETYELTNILVSGGCSIDDFSIHDGRTALSHAAQDGDVMSVMFLLDIGSSPSLMDTNGNYPLDYVPCSDAVDIEIGKKIFNELVTYKARWSPDSCASIFQ